MSAVRCCHNVMCALAIFATMPIVPAASLSEADWESTPTSVRPKSASDWSPYLDPFFTSRKTMAETTNWLRQTIEHYGDVPQRQTGDSTWIGNVRFNQCRMTWDSRRLSDGGANLEESTSTLNLADINSRYGWIQVDNQVRGYMRDGLVVRSTTRYYTVQGGRKSLRGEPREKSDGEFFIKVRPENDLPRRVGQALVHASRLCGGPPPSR